MTHSPQTEPAPQTESVLLTNKQVRPGVGLLTLHRPQARNALNTELLDQLATTLEQWNADPTIRAVVITGGSKVFAAGADIKEMAEKDAVALSQDARPHHWSRIRRFSKPLIAAVNGYALGGGCELAMCCDLILAGHSAQFGQPEINLGLIPGAGGTQRLARAVGKPLAMQMVLTGAFISAERAREAGLIAEITAPEVTEEHSLNLAEQIATKAPLSVQMAKAAVLKACEIDLDNGLQFERQAFVFLGATEDRKEGIAAFLEKRTPAYRGH